MGKLNILSGRELVHFFERFGWIVVRQKGSHIIMIKPGEIITLSIPDHKEVARGTLRSLLRSANISIDEYNKYF